MITSDDLVVQVRIYAHEASRNGEAAPLIVSALALAERHEQMLEAISQMCYSAKYFIDLKEGKL